MTDCPNGEMRDTLPDLLHDRLSPVERLTVEAHVAGCADCAAELALLRSVRASLAHGPAVDVARIAAAVPAYRPSLTVSSSRRSWAGWRVAAAIALLAGGGASAALVSRGSDRPVAVRGTGTQSVAAAASTTPPDRAGSRVASADGTAGAKPMTTATAASDIPVPVATATSTGRAGAPRSTRELAAGTGSASELTTDELSRLLGDLGSLDGVPSVDVERGALTPTRGGS